MNKLLNTTLNTKSELHLLAYHSANIFGHGPVHNELSVNCCMQLNSANGIFAVCDPYINTELQHKRMLQAREVNQRRINEIT